MKCYEFANNLKNSNNDIDKMLLVCLMLNFSEQDVSEMYNKYGNSVMTRFATYLEVEEKTDKDTK